MKSPESFPESNKEIIIEPEILDTLEKEEVLAVLEKHVMNISPEDIDKLYQEALEEMPMFRPNIEDFYDSYPKETIENDKMEIDFFEHEFKASDKKIGTIVEYLLFKNIKRWFGDKIKPILPSEYDDYVRGIDLVLEIPESVNKDGKYHAVSVDLVLGASERFIEKLMYIKKYNIDEGYKMKGPKYFKTDTGALFSGTMVQSVIGVAGGDFKKLCDQELAHNETSVQENIIPYVSVVQLLTQYKGFEEYASSVGKYNIADAYRQAYDDLSKASMSLLSNIATNPDLENKIESSRSIKNLKTFFKLLQKGDY